MGREPVDKGNYIQCSCPIHNGDNQQAFVYWKDTNQWKCFSHNCEEQYKRNIRGLICGVLKSTSVSINESQIQEILQKYSSGGTGSNSSVFAPNYSNNTDNSNIFVPIDKVPIYWCDELSGPGFNYTKEFCTKYEIGGLLSKKGNVYGISYRIYDRNKVYRGHTYRLLDYYREYILKKDGRLPAKWKHSKGLKAGRLLYGENLLDKSINKIIICESPKDTCYLIKNGFKNVVGTLGLGLKRGQENILIDMGFDNLIFFLDNDSAGNSYYETRRFKRTCSLFNVKIVTDKLPIGADPDNLSKEELENILL